MTLDVVAGNRHIVHSGRGAGLVFPRLGTGVQHHYPKVSLLSRHVIIVARHVYSGKQISGDRFW